MGCKQPIQFPAIYRDGELLQCMTLIGIDCQQTKALGVKQEKAYDPTVWKYRLITGFFISYEGIEYGSIEMDEATYFATCKQNSCNDGDDPTGGGSGGNPPGGFRIHVDEFDIEFV